jgi:hypothetical protein
MKVKRKGKEASDTLRKKHEEKETLKNKKSMKITVNKNRLNSSPKKTPL